MEPIEEDVKGDKAVKSGWLMTVETGCMGLKRKRMYCTIHETFDALWQKTFVMELKKNKTSRNPWHVVNFAEGDTVECRSDPVPLMLAILTMSGNFLLQVFLCAIIGHPLNCFNSCFCSVHPKRTGRTGSAHCSGVG